MDNRRRTRATPTKDLPVPGGPCVHNMTHVNQKFKDNASTFQYKRGTSRPASLLIISQTSTSKVSNNLSRQTVSVNCKTIAESKH